MHLESSSIAIFFSVLNSHGCISHGGRRIIIFGVREQIFSGLCLAGSEHKYFVTDMDTRLSNSTQRCKPSHIPNKTRSSSIKSLKITLPRNLL